MAAGKHSECVRDQLRSFDKNVEQLTKEKVKREQGDSELQKREQERGEEEGRGSPLPPLWRISVTYQHKAERVCWYGEEPTLQAVEGSLRQTFNIPANTAFILRNHEGDIVASTSKLPSHEQFTLEVTDNNGYGSDCYKSDSSFCSSSSSSTPSTPEVCHSGPSSPHNTPPLVSAEGKSEHKSNKFDRQLSQSESLEDLKREATDELSGSKKKRRRRKAVEIDRAYKCTLGSCRKVYGSENALKMHIKLKHPDQQNVGYHPYHASSSVHPHHPSYNMFMQPQASNIYNGYPMHHQQQLQQQQQQQQQLQQQQQQRPAMHSPHTPPRPAPTTAHLPSMPHQFPSASSLLPPYYAQSSPISRAFNHFSVPALIREPSSSDKHLPSIHSLPTLQPSHSPSLPYPTSPSSLFNSYKKFRSEESNFLIPPQARGIAW